MIAIGSPRDFASLRGTKKKKKKKKEREKEKRKGRKKRGKEKKNDSAGSRYEDPNANSRIKYVPARIYARTNARVYSRHCLFLEHI